MPDPRSIIAAQKNTIDKVLEWLRVISHIICVIAAAVGAAACFAALGWGTVWGIGEQCLRGIVAGAAGISGVILAADVAITHRGK
ncbi:hypothetical protein [Pseudonocardia adelaidensis]|uniref:Uncharacterized protein n=1 Tax=Pseudonocardia adelaidensis TaxID=648754 RepID=A0ABP9NI77_9PSEU